MLNTDRPRMDAGKWLAVAVVVFYTTLALLPLYLMVVSSFIPLGSTLDAGDLQLIPDNPTLDNFSDFNRRVGGFMPRWFANSFLVAAVPVVTNVFFGTMAGYALAKIRFPGRIALFWLIIATMTIPYFVTLIPLYEMIWNFNWIDSYPALMVPTMAGIGSVFLARQFMQTMPGAMIESATIDGCGHFGVFWHIVLPMARPLMAVLIIIGFVGAWTEYFWAYLVTNDRALYTIQMGIIGTVGVDGHYTGEQDYGEIMAASLLASIPVVIVFLAAQKHFVKGLTIGAVKG